VVKNCPLVTPPSSIMPCLNIMPTKKPRQQTLFFDSPKEETTPKKLYRFHFREIDFQRENLMP